jgi:spermidine synthase
MRKATYAGVFLIAMATLITEVLLTRITSVVAWYHLAFFVISLAMLGMTAGAVIVFVRPAWFRDEDITLRLVQGSGLLALLMPVGVWTALQIPLEPITDTSSFAETLGYGTALAIPFTVSGVVLTLALTRAGMPPGIVYGVDLVGAAAGCVLVIPLLDLVDAPSGILIASGMAALSGYAFARGDLAAVPTQQVRGLQVLTVLLIAGGIGNAASSGALLYPRYVKGFEDDRDLHAFREWNTYSRVTVDNTFEIPPALWAPSRMLPPDLAAPIPQRFLKIDGAAGTMMAGIDTNPDDDVPGAPDMHGYLAWDVTSFAHLLRPRGPAAVIGVGGGRDVLEAVRVGHDEVVGVELNDLIVHLHEGPMREFSGIADLPGVTLVNDEARSFMARDQRRYRVITMSLIDTWAATGAGAYSLSENGLYTVEGWRIFLSRLEPKGIFTVSRWYKPSSPGETARMLGLAMETLWSLGVKEPRKHIVLLQNQKIATLLVSALPFTERDIDRVQKQAVKRGYNMLLTPRRLPLNPMLRELAEIEDRDTMWAWASSQDLDFTPPTDERPFFFNMLRPKAWLATGEDVGELDHAFLGNLYATQTLIYATLASAVLTLFAVVIPLLWRRKELSGYGLVDVGASCGYFALIGLGFMFVEMGLLSRLNVFIGHPTLALASLLGGIIFFTGVGSLLSGKVPLENPVVARLYPLLPALLVVCVALAIDPVMRSLASAPTASRIMAGVAIVGVPALGMGLGFPLGLRLVGDLAGEGRPDLGPWMWGVNGACGVVASGLALTCSMAWGIAATLYAGAVCYVALLACTAWLVRVRT